MGRLAQFGKAMAVIFVPIGIIIATALVAGDWAATLVTMGLFGIVGLGLAAAGVGRVRGWLKLRASSATDPGAVDPGPAELEGVARPLNGTLDPPRSDEDTESLVYEHVVKRKRQDHSDGETREYWDTQTNVTETIPFVVEGDGGDVVVDPEDADLLLEDSYSQQGSQLREYVRRVDPDEEVYVAGNVVHATSYDGETDGRQYAVKRPPTRVPEVLRRLYDRPFVVADAAEATAEKRLFWAGVKVCGLALFYNAIYVPVLLAILGVI